MTLKQKKLSRNGYFIDKSNEYKFIYYVPSLIHRPACELTRTFYSTWVKPVCCVSKISSDCGCQSREIGIGMEVRLLSVGARVFFLAALRLVFTALPLISVAPKEKKQGTWVVTYLTTCLTRMDAN